MKILVCKSLHGYPDLKCGLDILAQQKGYNKNRKIVRFVENCNVQYTGSLDLQFCVIVVAKSLWESQSHFFVPTTIVTGIAHSNKQ
jgi:hypothetical protein